MLVFHFAVPPAGNCRPTAIIDRIVEGFMYVSIDSIITEGRLRLFFTPLVNDTVVGERFAAFWPCAALLPAVLASHKYMDASSDILPALVENRDRVICWYQGGVDS